MAGYGDLIKNTNAYKLLTRDKLSGRLSHAYMVLSPDKKYLRNYLKIFAKLLLCGEDLPCDTCRVCKGIDDERLTDVAFIPKEIDGKVTAEDINLLVEDSFIRPYELDKKIFIIGDIAEMNATAQNKLLKTLEEPPKGVHLLIGASSEHGVLTTIKSRVKKLEIPLFCEDELFLALKDKCLDYEKLHSVCKACDGTYGGAEDLYSSEKFIKASTLAKTVLGELTSSRDTLKVSTLISSAGVELCDFLDALEVLLYEFLVCFTDERLCENSPNIDFIKQKHGFNRASVIYALDKVKDAKMKDYYNGNDLMVTERLLLQILEGKYKWRKS